MFFDVLSVCLFSDLDGSVKLMLSIFECFLKVN